MAKRIEVRTQIEFDACVKDGNIAVCIGGGFFVAQGNSSVVAWGNSSVVARGNSSVEARGNSSVVARENSSVVAWGNSSVVAWGNSSVVAQGNSSVVARGNSSVVARENSSVEARENSSVVARGNSSVVARGNVFIRLFRALKIKAAASVVIVKHGAATEISGGIQVNAIVPQTILDWCAFYGLDVIDGVVTLFKAVNEDFTSPRGTSYAPGTIPEAPDWDGGKEECGGGLHFSPSPGHAKAFHGGAKRYCACPIKIDDLSFHPDGAYPEKVKARGCAAPVWEVDYKGNPIKTKEAA
jgi:hypothetical protein